MSNKVKRITCHNLSKDETEQLNIEEGPGWYLRDPNNPDCEWVGPYDTRKDAQPVKTGLTKFWRNFDA